MTFVFRAGGRVLLGGGVVFVFGLGGGLCCRVASTGKDLREKNIAQAPRNGGTFRRTAEIGER